MSERLKRIDFLGALLLVLAVSSLLIGLDRGSNIPWANPLTIGFLCATIPLVTLYLLVETKIAKEPVTPGHVIFNRAVFACYAHNFFAYLPFSAFLLYLPLFFQVVLQMTPVKSGASLIPASASAVFGTITGGIIIKRTGRFYWPAVGAGIAATLGCLPLVVGTRIGRMSLPSIYVGSVISFVPQGICVTASLIALSLSIMSKLSWLD